MVVAVTLLKVFQRSRPPCAAMARASRSFMCSSCDGVEKMRPVVAPKRPPPSRVDARGPSQMAHLWGEPRLPFEHEDKRNLLGTGFPRDAQRAVPSDELPSQA